MVHWTDKYVYKKPPVEEKLSVLKFQDIFGVCTYVFGFGFGSAFVFLVVEVIIWEILRTKATKQKEC